jgi:photosystem II stability/assembly factor-like uncharacterized protein
VTVTTPPSGTKTGNDRDLAQRVADLEALIEEARRRARRRRIRNAVAVAAAGATVIAGLIGLHGGGGGGTETAALAGSGGNARPNLSAPLAPLPNGNAASAIAFDPVRPNVVYVASRDARGGMYVYKTTDDGGHWRATGARGTGWTSDILTLTSDPAHSGTLYAGTDTAVYKTVNGGRSWRPYNDGLFPPSRSRHVCYPRGAGKRYCVRAPTGTPGTISWNRDNGWVLDVAADPLHSSIVYSASGAVRKSTDGGHTWKAVLTLPASAFPVVTRIAIAATRPESIYAITHSGRNGDTTVYKSTDGGLSWRVTGRPGSLPPSCCGDSQDALAADPENPHTIYAAVGDSVFVTTDDGSSWRPSVTGLPADEVTSLAVDTRHGGTAYAGVGFNLNQVNSRVAGAIYKTTDGGRTWSEIFSGFGVEKIAVDTGRPATIYAAGWAGRDPAHPSSIRFRLARSTDGGRTWITAA